MGNTRTKSRQHTKKEGIAPLLKNSLIAVIISIMVGFLLLCVFAVISLSAKDPRNTAGIFAAVALYISSFACGFAAIRLNGNEPILCGVVSALILNLFLLLGSVLFCETGGGSIVVNMISRFAVIFMAVLGSLAGMHRKRRKKHR